MLGRQEESNRDVVPLRGGYRPKRLKSRQLYLLQGLPQVGPTLAKRLLEHFGSVAKIVNATIDDLTGVEGIGPVSAKAIRVVLDEEQETKLVPPGDLARKRVGWAGPG
jgi:DNA excision repair protein ERCC-4